MKSYPTIKTHKNTKNIGNFCIAFDKMDGSNIKIEWNRKNKHCNGFIKFGTRTQLIDKNSQFGEVPDMFMNKYSEGVAKIFKDDKLFRGAEEITLYLEYFGENSFAGSHEETDEKDIVLFDLFVYKKSFIQPKDFIETFETLGIPNVIYSGIFDNNLIKNVNDNIYNLKEGVVSKGVIDGKIWMTKIKTFDWLEKVKNKFGEKRYLEEL